MSTPGDATVTVMTEEYTAHEPASVKYADCRKTDTVYMKPLPTKDAAEMHWGSIVDLSGGLIMVKMKGPVEALGDNVGAIWAIDAGVIVKKEKYRIARTGGDAAATDFISPSVGTAPPEPEPVLPPAVEEAIAGVQAAVEAGSIVLAPEPPEAVMVVEPKSPVSKLAAACAAAACASAVASAVAKATAKADAESEKEEAMSEPDDIGDLDAVFVDREGSLDVDQIVVGSIISLTSKTTGHSVECMVTAVDGPKLTVYGNSARGEDAAAMTGTVSASKVISWEEPIPESVECNMKKQTGKEMVAAQKAAVVGDVVMVQNNKGELMPVKVLDMRRSTRAERYGMMLCEDEGDKVTMPIDCIHSRMGRVTRSTGADVVAAAEAAGSSVPKELDPSRGWGKKKPLGAPGKAAASGSGMAKCSRKGGPGPASEKQTPAEAAAEAAAEEESEEESEEEESSGEESGEEEEESGDEEQTKEQKRTRIQHATGRRPPPSSSDSDDDEEEDDDEEDDDDDYEEEEKPKPAKRVRSTIVVSDDEGEPAAPVTKVAAVAAKPKKAPKVAAAKAKAAKEEEEDESPAQEETAMEVEDGFVQPPEPELPHEPAEAYPLDASDLVGEDLWSTAKTAYDKYTALLKQVDRKNPAQVKLLESKLKAMTAACKAWDKYLASATKASAAAAKKAAAAELAAEKAAKKARGEAHAVKTEAAAKKVKKDAKDKAAAQHAGKLPLPAAMQAPVTKDSLIKIVSEETMAGMAAAAKACNDAGEDDGKKLEAAAVEAMPAIAGIALLKIKDRVLRLTRAECAELLEFMKNTYKIVPAVLASFPSDKAMGKKAASGGSSTAPVAHTPTKIKGGKRKGAPTEEEEDDEGARGAPSAKVTPVQPPKPSPRSAGPPAAPSRKSSKASRRV